MVTIYGIAQIDFSKDVAGSNEKYSSQYYGLHISGVPVDGLQYSAEIIYEMGKSYITRTSTQSDIQALAGNVALNYFISTKMSPYLSLQYGYATGDDNRIYGYTTPSGNSAGKDSGFLAEIIPG